MTRKVPFQVRLIAFCTNEDGSRSIVDIVETSYRYAYHFTRRWVRDANISSFTAERP